MCRHTGPQEGLKKARTLTSVCARDLAIVQYTHQKYDNENVTEVLKLSGLKLNCYCL